MPFRTTTLRLYPALANLVPQQLPPLREGLACLACLLLHYSDSNIRRLSALPTFVIFWLLPPLLIVRSERRSGFCRCRRRAGQLRQLLRSSSGCCVHAAPLLVGALLAGHRMKQPGQCTRMACSVDAVRLNIGRHARSNRPTAARCFRPRAQTALTVEKVAAGPSGCTSPCPISIRALSFSGM